MTEPVSLSELKQHLDVARDDQDELLEGMIIAAREWVENYTGLILTAREVTEVAPSFSELGRINSWPLSTTPGTTIRYVDGEGAEQTFTTFAVRAWKRPATISADASAAWPSGGPVAVTLLAGYATPADVPYSLKAAIKLMAGDLYANRESGIVGTIYASTNAIENLCHPYRLQYV